MGIEATTTGPRVLYVGGYGRSGSTLLSRMLGEVDGFFSAGEIRFLWDRGLRQNLTCGCGHPFRECPFWQAVGEQAFGGWDALDPDAMVRLDRAVDRLWAVPLLILPGLSRSFRQRLDRYAEALDRVYRAIEEVAGCRVIVDASKDPHFAFILRHVPGLRVRVVHLVRDSRGVAYSWKKRIREPEVVDGNLYMPRFRPLESALRWLLVNSLFHVLGALGVPRQLMRYEALVEQPEAELRRAITAAARGGHQEPFDFLADGQVKLGAHHAFAGNPMRAEQGPLELSLDQEWKHALSPGERRVVSLVTWPLLLRYGYRRLTSARARSAAGPL